MTYIEFWEKYVVEQWSGFIPSSYWQKNLFIYRRLLPLAISCSIPLVTKTSATGVIVGLMLLSLLLFPIFAGLQEYFFDQLCEKYSLSRKILWWFSFSSGLVIFFTVFA